MQYVATNVRLPRETLQELKLEAVHRHKSMASLIREAVEQVYGTPKPKAKSVKEFRNDPIFSTIGICHSGIRDGAREHDRDIYGDKNWI